MTDEEYNERVTLIDELSARFPATDLKERNIKGYVWSLSDLSFPVLSAAIDRCINSAKYFPSVAEIRENAEAISTKEPEIVDCPRCFGVGMEQIFADGYKQVRRCDHVIAPEEGDPVDSW